MPTKKAARKQAKRIQRATSRLAPQSVQVSSLLKDAESGKFASWHNNVRKNETREYTILKHYQDNKWGPRVQALYEHHNAANHDFEEYRAVDRLATKLLDDINDVLTRLGMNLQETVEETEDLSVPCIVLSEQCEARRLRSYARMRLNDYEGSVEDATEGLAMTRLGLGQTEVQRAPGDGHPPAKDEVAMLVTRGTSLHYLQDYKGACQDLQAAIAAFNTTDEEWEGWPFRDEAVTNLLIAMALGKGNSSRPHYTEDEVGSIQKKLGLRLYLEDRMKCLGCGKKPSDGVALQKCGRCKNEWFCGRQCQRSTWESHKKSCHVGNHAIAHVISDDKTAFERQAEHNGFILLKNPECVIVRDEETGRYFDSLTDESVFFFPSQREEAYAFIEEGRAKTLLNHIGVTGLPPELAGRFAELLASLRSPSGSNVDTIAFEFC